MAHDHGDAERRTSASKPLVLRAAWMLGVLVFAGAPAACESSPRPVEVPVSPPALAHPPPPPAPSAQLSTTPPTDENAPAQGVAEVPALRQPSPYPRLLDSAAGVHAIALDGPDMIWTEPDRGRVRRGPGPPSAIW